jgi:hypothetical protein
MRRQLATSRRRWVFGILVASVVVLAVGASQGLAGASGNGTTVTTRYQRHNESCGVDNGQQFIGKARVTLSEDGTLGVKVDLHGADPGDYRVALFYANVCYPVDNLGFLKVGSGGTASKVFQRCCFSSGLYFLTLFNFDRNQDNDSLIFKL